VGRVSIIRVSIAALLVAVVLAALGVAEVAGALSNWQALALGVTQGFTELLPISSSGHLILLPWLADWHFLEENDAFNQTFDVALHLGTLVAVIAYFWRDIVTLLGALLRSIQERRVDRPEQRIAWFIVIATIPAALAGALGEKAIQDQLGEPWQIAIFLAVFGILLYLADRRPTTRTMSDLGPWHAVLMGCAQALALMPGVSRSGITITAGRLLELDRDSAARFSFLLLIPTVAGAAIYTGLKDVVFGDLPAGWQGPFVVGIISAAGSGLLAIHWLLGYVRRHNYTVFVIYRLVAAAVILLLIATGVREATF
jgi:undecaprenyl-diphosphatase